MTAEVKDKITVIFPSEGDGYHAVEGEVVVRRQRPRDGMVVVTEYYPAKSLSHILGGKRIDVG